MAESKAQDAVALLKADHREVEELFAQFEKAKGEGRKQELATKICTALKVHTKIEEEIFYPEFLRVAGDEDIHHEASVGTMERKSSSRRSKAARRLTTTSTPKSQCYPR